MFPLSILQSPRFVQHPALPWHTQPSRPKGKALVWLLHILAFLSPNYLPEMDGPRTNLWLDREDIPYLKDGTAEQGSSKEHLKPG